MVTPVRWVGKIADEESNRRWLILGLGSKRATRKSPWPRTSSVSRINRLVNAGLIPPVVSGNCDKVFA